MNKYSSKIVFVFLFCIALVFVACKDEFYVVNDSYYDGMQIKVKNPLIFDTLRIEQFNTDQIMLEELKDSALVFDSKAFIYKVEHDSVISVKSDGTILPLSRGVSKLEIIFRANSSLRTTIVVEIYKDYHPVESLQAASSINRVLIEKGYTFDLSALIFVFPAHADNKQLSYSIDGASQQYASIDSKGLITGIAPGVINVNVVSVDNPEKKLQLQLTVVNEIEITDVTLHQRLNNITIGVGERIDLRAVTGVVPNNVNPINRNLTFDIIDGNNVVEVDALTGVLTAKTDGVAQINVISKNNISKTFTVNVDANKKDLTRVFWRVNTSIVYATGFNYVVDGVTGKPEDMFDDNGATFLSMVKPGKTFNGAHCPPGLLNYFIVDMQLAAKFNAIRWNHRSGNNFPYLRVWAIDIDGSNDAENWVNVARTIPLPNTKGAPNGADNNRHEISLTSEFEYRYIKVTLSNWSDNSGGSTAGSSMQIGEFGLILK